MSAKPTQEELFSAIAQDDEKPMIERSSETADRTSVNFINDAPSSRMTKTLAIFDYPDGSSDSDPSSGNPGDVDIPPGARGTRLGSVLANKVYYYYHMSSGRTYENTLEAPAGGLWSKIDVITERD